MAREHNVTKLSKSILEMKFMKRTKQKVEKEIEDAESRQMYSHEITEEMRKGAGSFVMEPSFVPCLDLLVGRLSYRGMNPEIERLMELEEIAANDTAKEVEFSDAEMAAFHNPLVNTLNSKFKNKQERSRDDNCYTKGSKRHHSPDTPKDPKKNKNAQQVDSPVAHKSKKTKFMRPNDD